MKGNVLIDSWHILNNTHLNLKYFQVKRLKFKCGHESSVLKSKLSCKYFVILSSQVQSHQACDSSPSHVTRAHTSELATGCEIIPSDKHVFSRLQFCIQTHLFSHCEKASRL